MKTPTVTIGIPAYNEAKSISKLLNEIAKQNFGTYKLQKVLIYSDGSSDNTVQIARKFSKILPISVIVSNKRTGKAAALNPITRNTSSDVLIFLDADVSLIDQTTLASLALPIATGKADLCTPEVIALPPTNFISTLLSISMQYKQRLFESMRHGNNIYTCHGRARAFSKKLYKSIQFKESINEDAYSYLYCMYNNFTYRYEPTIKVWYLLPSTLEDHELQSVRFFHSTQASAHEFGDKYVRDAYTIPTSLAIKTLFKFTLQQPMILLYVLMMLYLNFKSKIIKQTSNTWKISLSSKNRENHI